MRSDEPTCRCTLSEGSVVAATFFLRETRAMRRYGRSRCQILVRHQHISGVIFQELNYLLETGRPVAHHRLELQGARGPALDGTSPLHAFQSTAFTLKVSLPVAHALHKKVSARDLFLT